MTDCTVCGDPIPAARILALPNATKCVSCLVLAGDVDKYKGIYQSTIDGTISVYYKVNPYLDRQLERQNTLGYQSVREELGVDERDEEGIKEAYLDFSNGDTQNGI